MSVERLSSVFLGGNRDEPYKREALCDYATLLSKRSKSDLADGQKRILHSLKLAAAPKADDESRVIMTIGTHSRIAFSSFPAAKLNKRVVVEAHIYDDC